MCFNSNYTDALLKLILMYKGAEVYCVYLTRVEIRVLGINLLIMIKESLHGVNISLYRSHGNKE